MECDENGSGLCYITAGAVIIKRWSCEVLAILRCYAASIGSQFLTFWGSLSAPSSRVKQSKKVKLFLSVPGWHIVKVEAHLHWFLTSLLHEGKSPALCSSHLTISPPPTINRSSTKWIGDLVGPSAWIGIFGWQILVPARNQTPHHPAHSTITLCQHHALISVVMNLQLPLHDRQLSGKGLNDCTVQYVT